MASIYVDHSCFEGAAKAVEEYVRKLDQGMNRANQAAEELSSGWKGSDYDAFMAKWHTIDDSSSVHAAMVQSLTAYAEYLRFAAAQYKNAQINAINRAERLSRRWF